MDRRPMTDDQMQRCEQWAADEEAERVYQQMTDEEMYGAEIMGALQDAERAYQRMLEDEDDHTSAVQHDVF